MDDYSIMEKLEFLYGGKTAKVVYKKLNTILDYYKNKIPSTNFEFTEKDTVLITYGDSIRKEGENPLKTLYKFLHNHLKGLISVVHILPFYPFSSDDGFSVIDYKKVNPELGSWDNIREIAGEFRIMFDAVINHISAKSREFQGFLNGDNKYRDYFITPGPEFDTSRVFRPRALPLLTEFKTKWGIKKVWTTFSTDQIDLNYKNPEVLLFIIDVLLFYVSMGASMIRLDAIAFLWKESGTTCIHLPQTHTVVKLFREIFNKVAPHVKIITETNVPHKENISYFGDGYNEAHLVYNFALPPLIAHSILTENINKLSEWAKTLETPSDETFFYNFTASHDGIGVLPAKGILSDEEIQFLIDKTFAHGGDVGYRDNPDGTKSPYELNITYFDLLSNPRSNEDINVKVKRFLASQAIMLSLKGIPAIYYHSLLGSQNYYEGVKLTGVKRAINREKLSIEKLLKEINTANSIRNKVFFGFLKMLRIRKELNYFNPKGNQRILDIHPSIFAIERGLEEKKQNLLILINTSKREITLKNPGRYQYDLLSGKKFGDEIKITPFETLWLQQYPQN